MYFEHKMKAKLFDIEAGVFVSVIHECDAKELGVRFSDRVELRNPSNNKCIVTAVNVSDSMVKANQIGIFEEVRKKLKLKQNSKVIVSASPQPRSVSFIKKKLNGVSLSENEISEIVDDIAQNKLSEIELSAFISAVYIHGFNLNETVAMTKELILDGNQLKISKKPVVDKHSIGGVNGRASMVIVPIVAAAGCFIPKTSSRAITSCSGTADSMEVLADVCLPLNKIKKITEKFGGVIAWGGAIDLAPVDDKIIKIEYPLKLDPKGQVVASVMGKKASVGAKFLVLDIPIGPDAKIKTREGAEELAKKFIEVGKKLGIKVECILTDGSEPSGRAFGPALEAKYAMEILEGKFFDNLAQKSCELAGILLELCGKAKKGKGYAMSRSILESGAALKKMKQIIKAQGKKALSSEEIELSDLFERIHATKSGQICSFDLKKLNEIARIAGAPGDKFAGVLLRVDDSAFVKKGDVLFEIFSENKRKLDLAKKFAEKNSPIELERIILEKIE